MRHLDSMSQALLSLTDEPDHPSYSLPPFQRFQSILPLRFLHILRSLQDSIVIIPRSVLIHPFNSSLQLPPFYFLSIFCKLQFNTCIIPCFHAYITRQNSRRLNPDSRRGCLISKFFCGNEKKPRLPLPSGKSESLLYLHYARSTFPDFKQEVQTYILFVAPFSVLTRTDFTLDFHIFGDLSMRVAYVVSKVSTLFTNSTFCHDCTS